MPAGSTELGPGPYELVPSPPGGAPIVSHPDRHRPIVGEPAGVLSVGLLLGAPLKQANPWSIGGEASYVLYPSLSLTPVGLGAFAQAQWQQGNGDTVRIDVGPQINWAIFGLEVGYSYRGADDLHRATHAVHLGPFFSMAIASFAPRVSLPVTTATGGAPTHPVMLDLAITLKWPFVDLPQGDAAPWGGPGRPGGRPLIASSGTVVALLRPGAAAWA